MSFNDVSRDGLQPVPAAPERVPDEVLEEMRLAAEVYARLAARGRELRFRLDPPTGKVTVGVHDRRGRLLYTIPPLRALEVAGGDGVDAI